MALAWCLMLGRSSKWQNAENLSQGKLMRKILAAGMVAMALIATVSAASDLDPNRAAVQSKFKGKSEPTAKDALWTSPTMFKVGVIDNGTSRDGYAQYVCGEIRSQGIKDAGMRVQIIDIVKLVRQDKWVKIGEATCR